ncbi:hypothetical protein [Marinomonas sp. 2405UD68-3]
MPAGVMNVIVEKSATVEGAIASKYHNAG